MKNKNKQKSLRVFINLARVVGLICFAIAFSSSAFNLGNDLIAYPATILGLTAVAKHVATHFIV
ncbi:MAG: hypothetical protein QM529_05020 [Hydrotalea sp.]|nr:hypothetical protein [Hydrotalea sp.]